MSKKSIACIIYDKNKQKIFIAKRVPVGDMGGKWEFPGGKIEQGESNEQALKRELQEEMELDVDVLDHFIDVEHQYPDFIIKMYCYKCKAHSLDFKLNVHKDFKWLLKEELNSLDWAEADKPIVKKILKK